MRTWNFYTAKELRPEGWMRRQLEIQAEGLSGNLDKVWRDVRDSAWIGGDAEGWERVPYWLDGFIPLAYLLDNKDMIERARKYVDAILAQQKPSGWICPCTEDKIPGYDSWAVQLISKVLVVYYECSGDERIPEALYRVLKNYYDLLKPEAMQVQYASRANDMVVASSVQIYRTYQVYAPKLLPSYNPDAPESVREILHCAAYFKIHNMLITVRPDEGSIVGNAWWPAESCALFLGSDRRYSAYYLPGCPVSVDRPDRLFLHGAWWNNGEAMLVLLNDTDETVTKRVTLDVGRMALAVRTGVDIFGRGAVTLDAADSFEVTLGRRETRFLRFARALGKK